MIGYSKPFLTNGRFRVSTVQVTPKGMISHVLS